MTAYVLVLTVGLGLYLLQNILHRLQRRLLIAVWQQTYRQSYGEKTQHLQEANEMEPVQQGRQRWQYEEQHDSPIHSFASSKPPFSSCSSSEVQAEDVVAHVRGLQRLEGLRNHSIPGLPMLFLFSWIYAGAVDLQSGCIARYPALGAAYHVFSWAGYLSAVVCLVLLIIQCVCLTAEDTDSPPWASTSSSLSGAGTGADATTARLALHALATTQWLVPVRRAIALVLGPLSLLLPTDDISSSPIYTGTALTTTSSSFLFSPFSVSEEEQALLQQDEQEQQRQRESSPQEESISDFDMTSPLSTSTRPHTRSGDNNDSRSSSSSSEETTTWLLSHDILQTALASSPFAIRHRTLRSGRSSPPPAFAPSSSTSISTNDTSSSGSSTVLRTSTTSLSRPSTTTIFTPNRHFSFNKRFLPLSLPHLICSALWACLHVAILCLVTTSFYLLGRTSALPAGEMEVCGAARGFLFALAMGFGGYLVLAAWLWVEKERSFRDDPEEHELKGLWLLRTLACLMVISFVWGVMVLREGGREGGRTGGGCWASQGQLHECVVAFVLLGSMLLFVAAFLHWMATGRWALVSVGQVAQGVAETCRLCLSLLLRLAPHQKLLKAQEKRKERACRVKERVEGREEGRREMFSSPANEMTIQVAEELSLLPFFHIRVIEGRRSGGGGGGGIASEEAPRGGERTTLASPSALYRNRQYIEDNDEESKQQQLMQAHGITSQLPPRALPYTPPVTITTPIGRVIGRRKSNYAQSHHHTHQEQEQEWEREQRRPRSRLGLCLGVDDDEKKEDKKSDNEDEVDLPAAVQVSLTPGEEEEDCEGAFHYYQTPRPLVLGATLNSIFDVTPLSLSPLRPRSAIAMGETGGLYLTEDGGAEGEGRRRTEQGNTCCPLPPLQV